MSSTRLVHVRRSLWATTVVLTTLGACLMVTTVGGLRWALARSEARSADTSHGREVIAQTHALARSASLGETFAGTFLVTRDPGARASYGRAVAACRTQVAALAALVAGDPAQTARVARIRELLDTWERESTAFLDGDLQDRGTLPDGAMLAPERISERRMSRIVSLIARMESLQRALDELITTEGGAVKAGDRAVLSLSRTIDRAAIAAALAMTLAAVAALVIFSRRVGRPLAELTASALAIAGGDLRRRVAVRGVDEIGSLASSFNLMAEQLDRQLQQDEALRHVRELMHAAHDAAEVERVVALLAPECLPGTSGRLHLLDAAGERLVPQGGWAVAGPSEPVPATTCWAFRMGRVHEASHDQRSVRCAHALDDGRDVVCIPLGASGAILGVLEVSFDRARPRGLTELGETLALTLANLRARDEMREQARRDPLTGAFNRRHFELAMDRELARAREAGGPLAVALLDIDHFKRFNDRHGHAAGDAVLRQVAATLSERCRGSDVVCRHGGEEFVVLFPECDLENATRKAEELRLAVREMKVQCEGLPLPQVTISVGVAASSDEGLARDGLLGAADEALYRSKAGGRDRVTRARRASPASAA